MTQCYYCNSEIIDIPYRCKFCGMVFCGTHRLPEAHNCSFDLKNKSKTGKDPYVRYQDALDFMSDDLTVAKIYDYTTAKQLNEKEAVEFLNFF